MFLTPYNKKNNYVARPQDIFDMDSLVSNFFNDPLMPDFWGNRNVMKVDIKENEKEYSVEAELPGVKKDEINIDLRDDKLTISVQRNEQLNEEKENYVRRERRFGTYSRCFYVDNIKPENVQAKYENGILTVILPKNENNTNSKNKKIDIQ